VFALADRYKIYDENQKLKYHMEGKIFSLRDKMLLYDNTNRFICRMQHRYFSFFNRYLDIFDARNHKIATLKKHALAWTPKLTLQVNGDDYYIRGGLFQFNFTISKNDRIVATVSKKWLSWGDTYEMLLDDREDEAFLVSLVVGIDSLVHNDRYNRSGH